MTTIGYRRKIKLIHKIEEPAKCVMNYDQIYIIQHFFIPGVRECCLSEAQRKEAIEKTGIYGFRTRGGRR